MGKKKKTTEDQPTFEEMMARLEQLADELESGELPLEKAIERYEEGVKCYKECHRILAGAEKKVEILTRTADGEIVAEPFEDEAGGDTDESETESEEKTDGDKEEGKGLLEGPGMPRAERRRSVRYAVKNCTARFRRRRMFILFEHEPHKGPVVDMSSHGIAFLTKRTLHAGDMIRISFDMPFEVYAVPRGFEFKARVKWVGAAPGDPSLRRVGCEFKALSADQHELMTRIIRYGILRER